MDAEEKKRTPEIPASPSATAPAQQPAAPAPSGGAFSNITPVQLDAAARAAAKQDVDRTLELADGLDIQLNDKFKSYDDDRKAALQYVTAAGIAFEHSLANAAGAPDLASRERVSLAADELGRRWAEYNGLADYQGADVVLDRNGHVHVRFNVGGKWTDDPEFGIERGPDGFPRKTGAQPFDYGKMHDYMTENGYLGQLGDADLEDAGKAAAEAAAATAAPDKPWADEGAFYKAGEAIPEWQRGAWYEKNAPVMFGDEEGKAIAARYAEYAKSKQSGGKPGNSVDALLSGAVPPPAEGKGGETPASGVDLNAVSKGAPAPEGGNPPAPGEPPAAPAPAPATPSAPAPQETDPLAAAFAAKPGETAASKPAAEARADKAKARREAGAAAAARMNAKPEEKPAEPEPYMVGQADLRDEKQLANIEANLKKQGFVVRKINGEHYMWHPKAKVWMASDGHTVVERNGTFVDSGTAPGKLQYETDGASILKANGPGGQGDVKETKLRRQVREDIPENFLKYLAFKNGANEEFLNEKSGTKRTAYSGERGVPEVATRKDKYGNVVEVGIRQNGGTGMFFEQDEETTNREEGRIHAFESGENSKEGASAKARALADRVNKSSAALEKKHPLGGDNALKEENAFNKEAIAEFEKMDRKHQQYFLDHLDEFSKKKFLAALNAEMSWRENNRDEVVEEFANKRTAQVRDRLSKLSEKQLAKYEKWYDSLDEVPTNAEIEAFLKKL